MYDIELINKRTQEITTYNNVEDTNHGEKVFYKFYVDTRDLEDGSYIINLYDDGDIIYQDTLNIGDFDKHTLQYERGSNIYVETQLNVTTEDKRVFVRNIETRIVSDDADTMNSVEVNATEVYDNGYSVGYDNGVSDGYDNGYKEGELKGYDDGYTKGTSDGYDNGFSNGVVDGIQQQKEKLTNIEITANGTYSKEDGYNQISVNVPDVNGSFDEGYTQGKADGINDGIEQQKAKLSSIDITRNGKYTNEDGYNEVNVNVQSDSYSYLVNTVDEDGLRALGWDDESIGYFKDNNLHYAWENDDYVVTPENIALKDEIKHFGDFKKYTNNQNLVYPPYISEKYNSSTYAFRDLKYLKSIPKIDTSGVTNFNGLFINCHSLTTIPPIDTSNVDDFSQMFLGCKLLTSIPLLNTSKANNMNNMFYNCKSLTTIPLLDTSNVTNMTEMFSYCKSLTSIPLLDTSNVTNMNGMFGYCEILTTIPPIDTINVTTMGYVFNGCSDLKTIPQLNTSNVKDMNNMFYNCKSLTTIPLLDTSNVTNMQSMFGYCDLLTTIPQLNTSKVTNVSSMFGNCPTLTSLPLLDFGSVTNIGYMFGYSNIKTLTDLGGFKNLKIDWNGNYSLAILQNLTYQSVINVITNLYDFRGNGDTSTTRTLQLHSNAYALLTDDDKALATSKGWNITK